MNCRRGDIVLVLFPDSNLRTSKRRPALVVQADQLGTELPQTIVAMITSNMARAGHPSRVIVGVGSETAKGSGLLMELRNHDRQSSDPSIILLITEPNVKAHPHRSPVRIGESTDQPDVALW